jgi:hypothetical protein
MGKTQEINYLTLYHPQIHAAEMAIVESDYLKAISHYDTAFKAVPKGFLKDYYNASLCATLIGNADVCYEHLIKVGSKGLSLDFIKDEFAFSSIQKDASWQDFEKKYLAEKQAFDTRTNQKLKADLEFMALLDAKYRKGNIILNSDSVRIIDKGNALKLEKIIKKNGFPDEELIGIGLGGFPIIQYPFYAVLRHQNGDDMSVNFSNEILKAIRQGKINPHIAVNILGTITGADTFFSRHVFKISTDDPSPYLEQPFFQKLDHWVHRTLEPEEEAEFDALRIANGMESMADYRKKIMFSQEDNRFLFPYKIFAGTWVINDPKLLNEYLEGTTVIK